MKKIRTIIISIIALTLMLSLCACGSNSKGLSNTTWNDDEETIAFGKDGKFSATGRYFLSGSWSLSDDVEGIVLLNQGLLGTEEYYYEISDEGVLTLTNAYKDSSTGEWTKGSMIYDFVREGKSTDILNNK